MKRLKFNFDTAGLSAINVQPQEGREIVAKMFENNPFFDYVTLLDGIKGGDAVPLLDFIPNLSSKSCGFNPTGSVKVSDAVINTVPVGEDIALCPNDLNKSAWQRYLPQGFYNELENLTAKDALILMMISRYGVAIRQLALVGSVSGGNPLDGLFTRVQASTSAISVTGTTITSSNAISELMKIYEAMPGDILQPEARPVIFINYNWAKAVIANSYNDNRYIGVIQIDENGGFELPVAGVRVQVYSEIPDNQAIAGAGAYMFVGTDLREEISGDAGFDMWYSRDHKEIRATFRARLGTAIAFANQFVKYV